jgi:hypothetical protein
MCIEEFTGFVTKKLKVDDIMPWKVMGEPWHRLPKGLVGGKSLQWDMSLLAELFDMIKRIASDLYVIWTNKVFVPFFRPTTRRRDYFPKSVKVGRIVPDVVVHTKRVDAVYVEIYTPKNAVPLGQIRHIGSDPSVNGDNEYFDILQFKFTEKKDLKSKEFQRLLRDALVE